MKKRSSSSISFLGLAVALFYAGGMLGFSSDAQAVSPSKVLLGCKKGLVTFVDAPVGLNTTPPAEGSSCAEAIFYYEVQDELMIDPVLTKEYVSKRTLSIDVT